MEAFDVLGDPVRRRILELLAPGERAAGDVAGAIQAEFGLTQPAVSRHLKVLESAGLISRSRRATARLSHIEPEPLKEASDWLARYRRLWEGRYEQLDELLETLKASAPDGAARSEGDVP